MRSPVRTMAYKNSYIIFVLAVPEISRVESTALLCRFLYVKNVFFFLVYNSRRHLLVYFKVMFGCNLIARPGQSPSYVPKVSIWKCSRLLSLSIDSKFSRFEMFLRVIFLYKILLVTVSSRQGKQRYDYSSIQGR